MSDIWKTEYHVNDVDTDETDKYFESDQRVEAIAHAKKLTEEGTPHKVVCAEYYNTEYSDIWEPEEDDDG